MHHSKISDNKLAPRMGYYLLQMQALYVHMNLNLKGCKVGLARHAKKKQRPFCAAKVERQDSLSGIHTKETTKVQAFVAH